MKRYSKQRETVLRLLQESERHPTAGAIYEQARQTLPNISLGTVYRNLSQLTEAGEVVSFKTRDGSEHYDACCAPHLHLCCGECGEIVDLEIPFAEDFIRQCAMYANAEIHGHHILFYGICSECRRKQSPGRVACGGGAE